MSSLASYFLYFSAVLKHNTFATVHVYNSFTVTDYLQQEANHKMSQIQNNRVRCKTHHSITRKTRPTEAVTASESVVDTDDISAKTVSADAWRSLTAAAATRLMQMLRRRHTDAELGWPPVQFLNPPTVFSTPQLFLRNLSGGRLQPSQLFDTSNKI